MEAHCPWAVALGWAGNLRLAIHAWWSVLSVPVEAAQGHGDRFHPTLVPSACLGSFPQDLQPLSIGHVADGHLADRFEKFFHRWISKYSRVGVLVVRLPVDGILLVIVHVLLLLPRCPPEA